MARQRLEQKLATSQAQDVDSQGFVVFFDKPGLDATSSEAIHVRCSEDTFALFIQNLCTLLGRPNDPKLRQRLNELYSHHAQSITNLERAMQDKLAQIARSYQDVLDSPEDKAKVDEAYQKIIASSKATIREKFIESLKSTINNEFDQAINLETLNTKLDGQKKGIYAHMLDAFSAECQQQNIPKVNYESLKHAQNSTPSFKNIEIKELTPESTITIKMPNKSSHDVSPEQDANARVEHYDREGKLKYSMVRSPIPIPPQAYYKDQDKTLTPQAIKTKQIADTSARLERIAKHEQFDNHHPIFQCLLTSYHTTLEALYDGSSEQTSRANLLPDIQDQFNLKRENNSLYFPFLMPTNGYGQEIKTKTGFLGFFRNEQIEELGWRNNMALAMQLGNHKQKLDLEKAYKSFLNANPEEKAQKKLNLHHQITQIQASMRYEPGEPKEKTMLKYIFKHNLHEDKEFARTTATLFCANANRQVILGCKSGNERTAMIFHRLDALYDGPNGGVLERFDQQTDEKMNYWYFQDDDLAKDHLRLFTHALETQVNQTNIYGTANHISSKDMGFDHKIAPTSWWNPITNLFNTNAAESSLMTNLVTTTNEKLQAHKDEKPYEQLSDKPGFLQSILNYLFGTDDSTVKQEPVGPSSTSYHQIHQNLAPGIEQAEHIEADPALAPNSVPRTENEFEYIQTKENKDKLKRKPSSESELNETTKKQSERVNIQIEKDEENSSFKL